MLSADADRHGQPERENGWREGPYLNSAFGNAKLSGQSFSGRYPRVGVLLKERLQGVLLAQLQNEPPPSRSSGAGACGRGEREKSQRTWGWERTRRKCPSILPAQCSCPCASAKPGARGRLCIWKSLGYTPRTRLRVKGSGESPQPPPTPESKEHEQAERKPDPPLKQSWQEIPPTKDQHTIPPGCGDIFHLPEQMPGKCLDGASPTIASTTMPVGGGEGGMNLLLGANRSPGHICRHWGNSKGKGRKPTGNT